MLSQGATADEADNINGPDCIRIPDWVAPEDRADPTAGFYADPEGDGLWNVFEHVHGGHPLQTDAESLGIQVTGAGPRIGFPWNPDANYTYHNQMNTNLLHGFEDVPFTEYVTTNGNLLAVNLVPDEDPGDTAFFRLRISPD